MKWCSKKVYRQQRERIDRLIRKWVKPLGLGWWKIEFAGIATTRKSKQYRDGDAAFTCSPMAEYRTATIEWFAPTVATLDDPTLERAFVHELMHLFLAELQHECDDMQWHIERACTDLAWAFVWAVDLVGKEEVG